MRVDARKGSMSTMKAPGTPARANFSMASPAMWTKGSSSRGSAW